MQAEKVVSPLAFVFEVTAKLETLHLDGNTRYMLHGKLSVADNEGEPMNLAISVPEDFWTRTAPGDALSFPLYGFIKPDSAS